MYTATLGTNDATEALRWMILSRVGLNIDIICGMRRMNETANIDSAYLGLLPDSPPTYALANLYISLRKAHTFSQGQERS